MIRLQLTSPVLAASLLIGAAPLALAAQSSGMSSATPAHSMHASERLGRPPRTDIKPFERAKLSLIQALAQAKHEVRGRTLDARFEVWHGKPVYLVRTYAAHQIWQARINANSGQPIGQPQTISRSQLGPRVQHEIAALGNAQTSLEQAISTAEQQKGGKAIMVRLRSAANGTPTYDLDLVKNGRLQTAMVNGESGKLR